MSEIPEDIMQAARAALRGGLRECGSLEEGCGCDGGECTITEERIARALLAERERCAAIADARADAYAEVANKHDGTPIGESNTMRCGAAAAIASAIRGQP